MRVALVTTIPHGGPVEHALLLARDLALAGVDVRALTPHAPIAARFAAAGVKPVALTGPLPLRTIRRAAAGGVAHSHDRRAGLLAGLALSRGPRVHTLHGLPDPYLPPPIGDERPGLRALIAYRGVERGLAQRAGALVVPSGAMADLLAARLGYRRERITVVPNAVDPRPARDGRGSLVGTLSVLERVKGLDVFLRAAAQLARDRPRLRFALFGTGSEETRLRALAAELGIADVVAFSGHVPADEALAALGLLVLPSLMENSPLALLEAMAAGVPVVASRVGGVPETAPADCAELVEPGDPDALTAAIGRVLDDGDLREERVRRARAHVLARGGPREVARRLIEIYAEVAPS